MSDTGNNLPPPPPGDGNQGGAYGAPPPPPPGGAGVQGTPPPNYLVLAILSILCCLPFGIASIIFSTQVNNKWHMGDQAGALDASKKAKLFAIIGLVGGILGGIIYAVVIVLAMSADPTLGT